MTAMVTALALAMPASAWSQELIPARRSVVMSGSDLPGGDIGSVYDTNISACERACFTNTQCEAWTFNQRNGSCFLKANPDAPQDFANAVSAWVVASAPGAEALAKTRRAELGFVDDSSFGTAQDTATNIGRTYPTGNLGADEWLSLAGESENNGNIEQSVAQTGAALAILDDGATWAEYARRAAETADLPNQDNRSWYQQQAYYASLNAYLRTESAAQRHSILVQLAQVQEQMGLGRDMIPVLRLAQSLQERSDTEAMLDDAISKYGFRIAEHQVESDLARPRICAVFSDDLKPTGVDYGDYVRLPAGGTAVELSDSRRLCVTGLTHGERYSLTFREGLPANDGQTLAKDIEITAYVGDRTAAVRFPGRGYVLPKAGDAALPVETVNIDSLDLELFRITDRNMLRAIQNNYFGTPIDYYDEYSFDGDIGEKVWNGTASMKIEVNKDVTTRLPMAEALAGREAGIYALRAAVPGKEGYDSAPAWQWFVVSDLGLTTMSGIDGLHVFVRSLGTAGPKEGVTVELLNRANSPLGRATTDAEGYARFDAGLMRGTGGASPSLIVVRDGETDISFLSLTDPEFDLSDRGVEGREPAPPVDVFLTTERGAYRAGETVYATAIARDPKAEAVTGLPLTAILSRPDGVEHSRQLLSDAGAGGYVFELPIAGSAPRGTWSLAIFADTEGQALRRTTFLVEDFLPERIDFTLDAGEEDLTLAYPIMNVSLQAKYLFGAPAADMAVESEIYLRAANGLKAWPGYIFGRYDQPFSTVMQGNAPTQTDSEGNAELDPGLPEISEEAGDRPLTATLVVRVAEGSGRPVERRVEKLVTPARAMIGVKPEFDGVVGRGQEARFLLQGVGADQKPAAMQVKWTLTRVENDWQWYQSYGSWYWEPVTNRTPIAEGEATLGGADPVAISAAVDWGNYELKVERIDGVTTETSTEFWAGWYAPADATATPDTLELSLDQPAYKSGDTAELRIVPRAAGTALITVLSNRLIHMEAVEVKEGENVIPLNVTDEWGAGVYVTASVLRPMDVAAGRVPSRALGLSYASVDPGKRALTTTIEVADEVDPRGPMDVAVKVEGVEPGETAYVTIAAVDEGILNLTGFKAPDPKGHFFGQRKLGIGIHDVYGRLIDGLNGAEGEVRSGGDAAAQARLQTPPPTEELVAYFTGPVTVDADGYARTTFQLPSFNGSVKVMALAWSKTGVGQADKNVLVRDPVVVTASLPRFLAPGDQSRLLLEIVHASGPSGEMKLAVASDDLTLGELPATVTLADKGKAEFSVEVIAGGVGVSDISVTLTTPDGKELVKGLKIPVQVNDPEIAKISRFDLKAGESFTFDEAVFADMVRGTGKSVMAIGPLARLNAPGLLASLDRYPYGCTEQMTSRAMPLIYFDQVARAMDLEHADNIQKRIDEAVSEILMNQGSGGGFGLWGPSSGDLWLDAYVTDFLSRARAQGYAVPDLAFRNALSNLRNRVNYAANFDAETRDGGTDLAYALMVLAREGAAAIGDLRYYADVKGDDFATPLAQAQIGAALASYGDQARADAMFRKAGARVLALPGDDPAQVLRADYGTTYRDSAAILTLAVEAGSTAINREELVNRIALRQGHLSTQEATWALMATNALIDAPDVSGVTIDGQAASGPLVRVLEDGSAPVVVKNDGQDTYLTVTTFGVPAEAEPAGGNGYAITRNYYTLDGEAVGLDGVVTGNRYVVELEVTPWDYSEGRLIIADPLPAGFEIDNPNLISGGDTAQLAWLNALGQTAHSEFRQDRFITQVDWSSRESFRVAYIVRAISPGNYHHPAASVEDMYRPDYRARTGTGRLTVSAE
ncbi:alpha-2-macroglobulin family protein [Xinfangfangia sp. D13-10-4-6]|nr:alpha-2-macroglobulin family protein [Pseudogemmobacter hezensis]